MTRVIAGCKHRVIKVVASFGEPAKPSRFTETMRAFVRWVLLTTMYQCFGVYRHANALVLDDDPALSPQTACTCIIYGRWWRVI